MEQQQQKAKPIPPAAAPVPSEPPQELVRGVYRRLSAISRSLWKTSVGHDIYVPKLSYRTGESICVAQDKKSGKVVCIRCYARRTCQEKIAAESERIQLSAKFDFLLKYKPTAMATPENMYFVTEICNAGSLAEYLAGEQPAKFPLDVIKDLAFFVGSSLAALRNSRRTHGAIRPDHILVHIDEFGNVSYRLSGWCVPPCRATVEMLYLAPEVRAGKTPTCASDVWSLGVILYLMATGKSPVQADPGFPSPKFILPFEGVPADLADLICMCLKMNPMERPLPSTVLTHPFVVDETELRANFAEFVNMKLQHYQGITVERRMSIAPYVEVEKAEEGKYFALKRWRKFDGSDYVVKAIDLRGITTKRAIEYVSELEVLNEFRNFAYILDLKDCFVCQDFLFIVMDWGKKLVTLKQLLSQTKKNSKSPTLSPLDINTICWGVASALREMHEKGLVYRNLNTRYIAIETNPLTGLVTTARIFNFWNCRAEQLPVADSYFPPQNMPPELLFTSSTDAWFFGMLMFKLLTGKALYKTDYYVAPAEGKSLPIIKAPPGEPDYVKLMMSCLSLDPAKRSNLATIVYDEYFRELPPRVQQSIQPYKILGELKFNEAKLTRKYLCKREGTDVSFEAVTILEQDLDSASVQKILLMYRAGDCPYIRRLHDFFWVGKTLYLIYDYFEGPALAPYIYSRPKEKPLSTKEVFQLAYYSIKAISHLHSRKVVYRNLRPESICVLTDPQCSGAPSGIKLISFGYAKALFSGEVGKSLICDPTTAIYFAPEVITGGVDAKADIWSYGFLLYFLIFGIHPLKYQVNGEPMNNPKDMYSNGIFRHPDSAHGAEIINVMTHCLKVQPEERPTAADILAHPIFISIETEPQQSEADLKQVQFLTRCGKTV